MNWKKVLIFVSRRIWFLVAALLIGLAVVVSLGREMADKVDRYRLPLNEYVSELLGRRFKAEHLSASWERLVPSLKVSDISVYGGPDQSAAAITLSELSIKPNLIQSLLAGELIWRELSFGQAALTLQEDEQGLWSIAGFPLQQKETAEGNIFEMLMRSSHIEIDELVVTLAFYSGTRTTVDARQLLLENVDDFHRLQADLAFDGRTESARLVLEATGDAGNIDSFSGNGYLRLNRINFDGALSDIANNWFPEWLKRIGEIETDLDAEIWFDMKTLNDIEWVGRVSAAEIPMNWLAEAEPIRDFQSEMTGWFRAGNSWGLRWQGVDFTWAGLEIVPFDLTYSQQMGANWSKGLLSVSQFDVAMMSELLLQTKLAPEKTLLALKNLQPKGLLRAVHLDIALDKGAPQVKFRANLDDVSIESWNGGPASRQVNGYVESSNTGGLLELDSPDGFAMYYPMSYSGYMEHSSVKGQLRWDWDSESRVIKVSSGPIDMGGEEGAGRLYLYMDLPPRDSGRAGEMFLLAGVKDMDAKYRNRYIPKTLKKELLTWLDEAPGEMNFAETGFIWRGATKGESIGRTAQLHIDVRNGELKFQPDWPPLQQMDVIIDLDDIEMSGTMSTAVLGGIKIDSAQFQLSPPKDQQPAFLKIQSEARGDIGDAMALIASSSQGEKMTALSTWQLSGKTEFSLDLTIPIKKGAAGGLYQVDSTLNNVRLSTLDGTTSFENLTGIVKYHSKAGMSAKKVSGQFWGQPLLATIKTQLVDQRPQIVIEAKGVLVAESLSNFLQLPAVDFLSGSSAYQAEMILPFASTDVGGDASNKRASITPQLTLNTSLRGFAIDLPAPFGKAAAEVLNTKLTVNFSDHTLVNLALGAQVTSVIDLRDGVPQRAVLALNQSEAQLPSAGEFQIKGSLTEISLSEWQVVYERLQSDADFTDSLGGALIPTIDVQFGRIDIERFTLQDVTLKGSYQQPFWNLAITSDLADGDITIEKDAEMALTIALSRLSLAKSDSDTNLSDIDPTTLPALKFSVEDLSVGDVHYGSAAFDMSPQANGVLLDNIQINARGLRFGDADQHQINTQLLWQLQEGQHSTQFEGVIRADDVGDVLEARGLARILDSDKAYFLVDFNWQDSPFNFSAENIQGALAVELKDGRFYQSPKGAANALIRTIGLFNFANWTQRLKLDFSDLFEKGMSYKSLHGGLYFDRGMMTFDPPMVVEMQSGRMKLMGNADLLAEQIDAQLVTTLPVGTNLPWMAALVGGLPAAVGVYITSKIFKKQVDKLSSISYRIEGDWADPDIEVVKIFSDNIKNTSRAKKSESQADSPSNSLPKIQIEEYQAPPPEESP